MIFAKVGHARRVETFLLRLGWLVAVVGFAGMVTFTVLWITGDLNAEQGLSLVLGTTLATALSGATAYAAAVNIGLGAERLEIAAREAGISPPPQPASERSSAGSSRG